LDTSAWIEFFVGSDSGEKIKEYLENSVCFTSIVSIAEVSNWAAKNNMNGIKLVEDMKKLTEVIDLTGKISFLAGIINNDRKKIKKDWGIMDSFILATAEMYELRILTKDTHFNDLTNVEML
ncbi:PIN domain-containing protein, partial [archaeon]|nr:PIN domain-containing protein [archaeon]